MRELAFVDVSSQMSGVEFSTLYLAQHLDRARWTSLVICPEEGDLPERCRESRVSVVILPRLSLSSVSARIAGRTIVNPLALIADVFALVASARRLAQVLRKRRPSLVVTKGLLAHFYGGLAARRAGVPCVWHVQDRVSNRAGALFPWTISLAARWLADQVIADADSISEQLRVFVPGERISVIWNGVDTEEFSPQVDGRGVRAEWGLHSDQVVIGGIGRLTPWKGQSVLIQAFALVADRFPSACLALIGSAMFDTDAYARSLQADVKRLGLEARVLFAGFRRDLPDVLAALDIVAHTALEKDSSPLAVVSAMATGKPIVCSRVKGTAELFEDGVDGLLVPPGDPEALAEKLGLLLGDAEIRSRLGRAARTKVERCLSIDHFARQCEAVFERALE